MLIPTGVPGLDAILRGGLPANRTIVVAGGPGSGKTMLGMQFLARGAADREPGLMLSFEESPERMRADVALMTFPCVEQIAGKHVHFVDGRPPSGTVAIGAYDIQGLIAAMASIVRKYDVRRIVIDAIDVLFTQTVDHAHIQNQITTLLRWLDESAITCILTVKAADAVAGLPSEFSFAEFAADGVIQLRSSMHRNLLRRSLRVLKVRGASFATGDHPYTLSDNGMRVLATPLRTFAAPRVAGERCSTGVERLDRMLEGGYLRGTTTLISGLPGASKTTFSAAFIAAGCAAGERGLYVGFDEPADQMIENVRSIGIDLAQYRGDLLRCESFSAGAAIADDLVILVENLVDEHQPARVVIDPISALIKSGGSEIADRAIERIVVMLKTRGVTSVFTTISESDTTILENTPSHVSTVADAWIHLSFASAGGERNRTLTVVKSRGTAHSAQMREVELSQDGISLADVYSIGGAVLFGTARYEREESQRVKRVQEVRAIERDLQRLNDGRITLAAKLAEVQRELERLDERHAELAEHALEIQRSEHIASQALRTMRQADPDGWSET
jgi:circadian clock protein KaiC